MLKEPAVRATYIEPSQLVKYYHTRGIGKPESNGVLQHLNMMSEVLQSKIHGSTGMFHSEIKNKKISL